MNRDGGGYTWLIQATAAEALGHMGDTSATSALIDRMNSGGGGYTWEIQVSATKALGYLGDTSATSSLINCMNRDGGGYTWLIQATAAEALGHMGDTSATSALITRMNTGIGGLYWVIRAAAAEALGMIGENESNKLLVTMFSNSRKYPGLRRAAIEALDGKVTFDVFDVNGDGLPDRILKGESPYDYWYVQINNRSGFNAPIQWQGVDAPNTSSFMRMVRYGKDGQTLCDVFDINGDGRPDRIMRGDSPYDYWYVQLNNGEGFDSIIQWTGVESPINSIRWKSVRYLDDNQSYVDIFDINGDSLPDRIMRGSFPYDYWYVQLNNGTGFDSIIQWQGVDAPVDIPHWRTIRYVNNMRTYVDTFDINGDGLPDRVMHDNTSNTFWRIQLNNGISFDPIIEWQGVDSSIGGSKWRSIRSMNDRGIVLVDIFDINADGLPDRIMRGDSPYDYWYVQYNTGSSFEPLTHWSDISSPSSSIFWNSPQYNNESNIVVMMLDINGDGLLDRVIQSNLSDDYWQVQFASSDTLPDLLEKVNNGKGGETQVAYEPSTRFANLDLSFPIYVVTQARTVDNKPDGSPQEIYAQDIEYEGGYYHYEDKEFRGFEKVIVTDPISQNYAELTFHQGIDAAEDCYKGRILEIKSFEGTGDPISHVINRYSRITGGTEPNIVNFVFLRETETTAYEGEHSLTTKMSYDYDDFGNIKNETEEGDINATGDEKISHFEYNAPYEGAYNTLKLSQLKDKDENILKEVLYNRYDDHGNLLEKEFVLDIGPKNPIILYTYYPYGCTETVTNANNHTTTTRYDSTFHIFPYEVENAKSHITTYEYDPKLGVVKSVRDPNGNTFTTGYDALGRITEEKNADNEIVTKHSYPDFNTKVTEQLTLRTEIRYDGLGRAYMTITSGEHGDLRKDIVAETYFDERSKLDRVSLPHYVNTDPSQVSYVRYIYDIRGRVKEKIYDFPGTDKDYEISTNFITPNKIETIDPLGHKKTVTDDAYGNIVEVTEHTAEGDFNTKYEYNLKDDLKRIEDAKGNETVIVYDSLGRKRRLIDPDSGTTQYLYDAVGNLLAQFYNNLNVKVYDYDELERIKTKLCFDGTPPIYYYYDEPASSNGIGKLSRVVDHVATTKFNYDKEGRLTRFEKEIDSDTYVYQTSYDILSRVDNMTYPDGEIVNYTYDVNSGLLEEVEGDAVYVQNITYDDKAKMEDLLLGNNVLTDYTYGIDHRLDRIYSETPSGALQDLNYTYDKNGNISSINSVLASNIQSFSYDDLDRLTDAYNVPSITGGVEDIAYRYDSIGNMLQKGNLELTYPNPGQPRPHAPLSLQITEGKRSDRGQNARGSAEPRGARPIPITYDDNGNMITKGGQTYKYGEENHLIEAASTQSGEEKTVSIALTAEWNFLSFPIVLTNNDIASALSSINGKYAHISKYNPELDKYEHYVGHEKFDQFDTFEYGEGYLIYITEPCELILTGVIPDANTEVQLKDGYNLITAPTFKDISVEDALNNLEQSIDYDYIYEYTGSAYIQPAQLETGKSYYIHCLKDTTWNVPVEAQLKTTFAYDKGGERIRKTEENQFGIMRDTLYITPSYEIETTPESTTIRKHIFAGPIRVCTVETNEATKTSTNNYFLRDHLGSTDGMTDQNAGQTEELGYTPYGNLTKDEGEYNAKYKYNSKELDSTGLYYYGARYYDPELGRFITPDPISPNIYNPQNLNKYTYCLNNPIKNIDPAGNEPVTLTTIAIGIGLTMLGTAAVRYISGRFIRGESRREAAINAGKSAVTAGLVASGAALIIMTGGTASPIVSGAGSGMTVGAIKSGIIGESLREGAAEMAISAVTGALCGGGITGEIANEELEFIGASAGVEGNVLRSRNKHVTTIEEKMTEVQNIPAEDDGKYASRAKAREEAVNALWPKVNRSASASRPVPAPRPKRVATTGRKHSLYPKGTLFGMPSGKVYDLTKAYPESMWGGIEHRFIISRDRNPYVRYAKNNGYDTVLFPVKSYTGEWIKNGIMFPSHVEDQAYYP